MNEPQTTTPAAAVEALVARVVDEYEERLGRGEKPDPEEYAARHPEAADEIRGVLGMFGLVAAPLPPRVASPPDALGDYRIVCELGRGGMAVVYEAEQLSLRRRVALKVLPFAAAMDQRGQQRFRNEALAAAALDHPHIVRVHAVGCERGVHYIAMQLIDGRSLADLIAGRRPPAPSSAGAADPTVLHRPAAGSASTEALARQTTGRPDAALYRQAAEWCAQAADALEHAHDQGVVHRDVKPANLLVDGCGHLWVADFGLAQLASDPGLTASGDLLGTPRYMSPEQAQAKHNLVDHRADVYALGATLYELLTGQVAVPGNTREEVFRRIAEGEPVPPQRLDRRVPPELETVCLKCLAKDPAERYQTAGELADDLRRFLADEPIRAKPPTARQRAARWVRRHPRAVAVGVLAVVVALAGGAAWERRRAADRLAVAEAEAAARQVAAEAEGLYRQGRYPEALAVARRAVDLLPHGGGWRLRDGVARLAADLELANSLEEARMEAAAQTGLDGRKGFGRLAALPGYRRAFQSYGVDVLGGDEQVIADRLRRSIAWSEIMTALDNWAQRADDPQERARVGRLAGAIGGESQGWIARARRASEARDAKGLAELAAAMLKDLPPPAVVNQVANYLEIAGAHKEGELLLRAGTRRYPGDFWLNLNLGRFLMWPGAPAGKAEAVEYTRAALSLRPASPGAWANLGAALGNADRWPEAEAADRRAIELAPRLAYAHSNLASSLARKGQFREAEAAARQAIELVPGEAYAHCNLADALFRQGRYREAEAAARRATELLPGLAEAHTGLSRALLHLGRPREAEAASRRVVELRPGVAEAHAELANTLGQVGRFRQAEEAARRALELEPDLAPAHCNLGIALFHQGRLAEAEAAYRRALVLQPDLVEAVNGLGVLLGKQGKLKEAEATLRRAIALRPSFAAAHNSLGEVLLARGQLPEAEAACRKVIELQPDLAGAHGNLGNVLVLRGRVGEAEAAFRRAVQLAPEDHMAHFNLGGVLRAQRRLVEAEAAYRRSIALNPDHAESHCNLGAILELCGRFAESLAEVRRGHELGSKQKGWQYPSAGWVRRAERLAELDGKLPAVLAGEAKAADADEALALAELCLKHKGKPAAAARLFAGAFDDRPELADGLNGHRYNAACAAAVAGCGQGKDAAGLSEADRGRFRRQALGWLTAELAGWAERAGPDRTKNLHHWEADPDLAGVREEAALAKFPAPERAGWKKLWAEVADLLSRGEKAAAPEKRPGAL